VVIRVLDIRPGEMLKWTTFFNVGLPLLIGSLYLLLRQFCFSTSCCSRF
jgi:hypothetical protein